jgi:hypothetical protein
MRPRSVLIAYFSLDFSSVRVSREDGFETYSVNLPAASVGVYLLVLVFFKFPIALSRLVFFSFHVCSLYFSN